LDKLAELVEKAKAIVAGDPDRESLWRAYVALEYAIMEIKLRHGLEGEAPPAKPAKKAIDIAQARSALAQLDLSSDNRKLLHDLRSCRDVVKILVANYDRRSTTS
jgi:hypothetical protein